MAFTLTAFILFSGIHAGGVRESQPGLPHSLLRGFFLFIALRGEPRRQTGGQCACTCIVEDRGNPKSYRITNTKAAFLVEDATQDARYPRPGFLFLKNSSIAGSGLKATMRETGPRSLLLIKQPRLDVAWESGTADPLRSGSGIVSHPLRGEFR